MKNSFKVIPGKLRQYWGRVMDSTKKKMSFGASCINKIICVAHGDQWRRGHGKRDHGKKSRKV